jgi:hypothetical protein
MARLPLTEWRAEQFRLSAFPALGAATRSADWWEAATGLQPEQNTANPRKGSAVISGPLGTAKLVLGLEPDRIDWLLVPDIEAMTLGNEVPHLGALTNVLGGFSEIIERWLARDDVPELARLAFGAVLNHPESDRRSGYQRLPDYVPVEVNPDSTDFQYQINLPVASRTGVEGLEINRLSKWSVAVYTRFALRVNGGVAQRTVQAPLYAFRVELDINTSQMFEGALPRPRLIDLYRELASLGQDVAAAGVANR